jgi:hypothetical protein
MLTHLLYGSSSLTVGNLKFDARLAGDVSVTLAITIGADLAVTVEETGLGSGSIVATVLPDTTELQLVRALRSAKALGANFNALARVALVTDASGEPIASGLDPVTPIAETPFPAANNGLLHWLEGYLGINGWGDRELIAKDNPVGLLWPAEARVVRRSPSRDGCDIWRGLFQAGVALQTVDEGDDTDALERAREFARQNALAGLYAETVYYACKVFKHPDQVGAIGDAGEEVFGFQNSMKDETSNRPFTAARVRTVGTFEVFFKQAAFDAAGLTDYPLNEIRIGLFRNPLAEAPGGPGAVLDQLISITPPSED